MKHEQTNVLHDVKSGRHRRCIFESLKTGYDKRYGFNIIVRWIFYLKKFQLETIFLVKKNGLHGQDVFFVIQR